ncbi:MAG TPA: ATP-dependent Clp protease adaptor ClpS [Elusimicrobiota bacterium]|nr:ATP-dependent Clp protease adaptor ClpS [Elusimicrobiota bacterium]
MPASLHRPHKIKKPTDGTTRGLPWSTILFNCNCHSFDDVASQLMKAIRVSYDQGMRIAEVVHSSGKAVVYTGHRERCEAVAMVLEDIGLRVKVAQ